MASNGASRHRMHVVAVPYPGRGHVNPMLNLCRLLAARGLLVTAVVTHEWLALLAPFSFPDNLRLRTIPDVVPSERHRAKDISGFVQAVLTKMGAPVDELIGMLDPPGDAIVVDAALCWAPEIGRRRSVPVLPLFTMSASVFLATYWLGRLAARMPPIGISGQGNECLRYLPGYASTDLQDFLCNPSSPHNMIGKFIRTHSWCTSAHNLLFTSFYESDREASDVLKSILQVPIYHLATAIPHATLHSPLEDTVANAGAPSSYYIWLDSKPVNSVLYVSLGSFLPVSDAQMDELAAGLHASGVQFMWVARGEAQRMQELVGGTGIVVPWCDQLRVLCHPSVGGFLTHCGWNSTQEGLFAGVPMLTFPVIWDQFPNSKLVVDDWRVGARLKEEQHSLVGREKIAKAVAMLMDLDQSKEMRRRAEEMKAMCRKSLEESNSLSVDLDAFVCNLLQRTTASN